MKILFVVLNNVTKFFMLMLFIITTAEPSKVTICTCDRIESQNDCKAILRCVWAVAVATDSTPAVVGSCGIPPIPIITEAHFPQVNEPAINFRKTMRCAYIDSKCTHFTECTDYVKTKNLDCQALSDQCTTDGTLSRLYLYRFRYYSDTSTPVIIGFQVV